MLSHFTLLASAASLVVALPRERRQVTSSLVGEPWTSGTGGSLTSDDGATTTTLATQPAQTSAGGCPAFTVTITRGAAAAATGSAAAPWSGSSVAGDVWSSVGGDAAPAVATTTASPANSWASSALGDATFVTKVISSVVPSSVPAEWASGAAAVPTTTGVPQAYGTVTGSSDTAVTVDASSLYPAADGVSTRSVDGDAIWSSVIGGDGAVSSSYSGLANAGGCPTATVYVDAPAATATGYSSTGGSSVRGTAGPAQVSGAAQSDGIAEAQQQKNAKLTSGAASNVLSAGALFAVAGAVVAMV